MVFIHPFTLLNFILALVGSWNSFRGFKIIRKQLHSMMHSLNMTTYFTLVINLMLFVLLFFRGNMNEKILNTFNTFNPMGLYIFLIFLQVWCVIICSNLEPLYQEFHSTSSLNQQLLIKF